MNLMSFQSSRISPLVPLGTTHGTMENARLHREEMVDVANEIVDKKMKELLPQIYQEALYIIDLNRIHHLFGPFFRDFSRENGPFFAPKI